MGPVGVFLAGMGPWGLAAAAGIGLVAAGLSKASEMAHELGTHAIELQHYAETTGLATDQIQALTQAAALHGVQAEQTVSSIEKFTAAWEQLRNGGGTMLDEIRKVDAGLADQMQRTKDSATAFDLLTQAISKASAAGDIAQRNALAKAAGGRGGIAALVGISSATTDAGGLGALTSNAAAQGGILDPQLINRLHTLQAELEETKKRSNDMVASIFSEAVLQKELQFAQAMERGAAALKEMADQQQGMSWLEKLMDNILRAQLAESGVAYPASSPMDAARGKLATGLANGQQSNMSNIYQPQMAPPSGADGLKPEAVAAQWKTYVSALG